MYFIHVLEWAIGCIFLQYNLQANYSITSSYLHISRGIGATIARTMAMLDRLITIYSAARGLSH